MHVEYGGTTGDGAAYLLVSAPSLGTGSVRVVPSAVDGLTLDLDALSAISGALPKELRSFVNSAHDFAGLPGGITIERIEATEGGMRVILKGENVTIAS